MSLQLLIEYGNTTIMKVQSERTIRWAGDSRAAPRAFPADVRWTFGRALHQAQKGKQHRLLTEIGGREVTEYKAVGDRPQFEVGSGNVFADLGIPEPEEALAKARLADLIDEIIQGRRLTQVEAGELLGIDQGTVSKLVNGRLDGFSQERLIRYLTALGHDVEIVVRRASATPARGRLTVASG